VKTNANLAFNNTYNDTLATWFSNTGANRYMTPDLLNMKNLELYLGNDQLHIKNGKGLAISSVSHSTIHTHKHIFTLLNVLYVPYIKKAFIIYLEILS
jgi:hypothetical protein